MNLKTPYYLISEKKLLKNLEIMKEIREKTNGKIKFLMALKCFSTPAVFPLLSQYMDGTTSSSFYELKLGIEEFKTGEHCAYSVAYSQQDIEEINKLGHTGKVIFNSLSQYNLFHKEIPNQCSIGLRLNPNISASHFLRADPARKDSRLGQYLPVNQEFDNAIFEEIQNEINSNKINGLMWHNHCENDNFNSFKEILDQIEKVYQPLLSNKNIKWVSMGGGIHFTGEEYLIDQFISYLKAFCDRYNVVIYLEPGEATITQAGKLITTVLDNNQMSSGNYVAVVDASTEAHMLDLLLYDGSATATVPQHQQLSDKKSITQQICGNSCLAGDIFSTLTNIVEPLKIGDQVVFENAAGYTMVKKNWFNGVRMPSIIVERLNGKLDIVREFTYDDFKHALS